jgi:hypothetical protein
MRLVTFAFAFGIGAVAASAVAQAQDAGPGDEIAALEPAVDTSLSLRETRAAPAPPVEPPAAAEAPAPAGRVPATQSEPAEPAAIDRLDLGTTSITGNQELPKVLYVVPWKRSDLGDLIGRPVNTLLDEVLAPVDRRVFERHLSYYETLHGESQEE